jgi:hypothetical protein
VVWETNLFNHAYCPVRIFCFGTSSGAHIDVSDGKSTVFIRENKYIQIELLVNKNDAKESIDGVTVNNENLILLKYVQENGVSPIYCGEALFLSRK